MEFLASLTRKISKIVLKNVANSAVSYNRLMYRVR